MSTSSAKWTYGSRDRSSRSSTTSIGCAPIPGSTVTQVNTARRNPTCLPTIRRSSSGMRSDSSSGPGRSDHAPRSPSRPSCRLTGSSSRAVVAASRRPQQLISLKETEARDLLEIVHGRHKRASTIFCSQFSPAGWHNKIGEATLADTILDRIVHDSYSIEIHSESDDPSMREVYGLKQEEKASKRVRTKR